MKISYWVIIARISLSLIETIMIVKVNNTLTKQLIKMLSNLRKQCKIDFWHIKRTLTISTLFQFGARLSTGKKRYADDIGTGSK